MAFIFDTFPSRLNPSLELTLFLILSIYLFLFAGLRTMGLEFDYSVYKRVYYAMIAENEEGLSLIRFFLSNARKIIIFAMFSYLLKISQHIYSHEKCRLLQIWYNSYFIGILFPIVFSDLGGFMPHRGALLFRPVEIFLFSELSEAIGMRKISRMGIVVERFFLLLFISYLCVHNINNVIYTYDGFIPYKWEF